MNDRSTQIENGKAVGESAFYHLSSSMLGKEYERLCELTDTLDKDPELKKEHIAEYKCAKYRSAAVGRIYNLLQYGYMVYHRSAIHIDIENCINNNTELLFLCDNAPDEEKIDYKLYYGISFITEDMYKKYLEKLGHANDYERIELEERVAGLLYCKECLDEAWQKRKDVAK